MDAQEPGVPGPARPPAPTRAQTAGFLVMVFGMFMAILDIQIVASSIAEIQAGLSAAPDEASWVQTSYLMAEIVMIPLSGFLSRIFSTRVLFVASCLGFTLSSLACALATTLPQMILFRALQGFLGGAMIPTVFATSFLLFRGERRMRMSLLLGLTATLAPTIGPTLGGWITQALSWHWLFLVNVPIGLVVAATVWRTLDIDRGDRRLMARFDWWGLVFMAGFLGSLEYVMEEGPRWDWLEDPTVAAAAAVSAACAGMFLWRAFAAAEPIVQLRAFRDRNFAIGCGFSFILGMGLYGAIYIIPLFLARIRGFDALQIGEVMAVTGACMFLGAPFAGLFAKFLDMRALLALGLVLFGVSVWLTARLTAESAFAELAFPLGLRGFALMFVMLPINQVTLGTLAPEMLKNASGLYNLMRNLGGAVGLAAINTLAQSRGSLHRVQLAEQVSWDRVGATGYLETMTAALSQRLASADAELAALRAVRGVVEREAMIMAYNDILHALAALFLLVVPLVLLLRRVDAEGSAPAH